MFNKKDLILKRFEAKIKKEDEMSTKTPKYFKTAFELLEEEDENGFN